MFYINLNFEESILVFSVSKGIFSTFKNITNVFTDTTSIQFQNERQNR